MKIVLSVQPIKFPLTGIGRYTFELAHKLQGLESINQLSYFSENRFLENIPGEADYEKQPEASMHHIDKIKRTLARSQLVVNLYRYMKSMTDKDIFQGFDEHIYHGTNFYIPKFPGISVVTIHDLSVFTMPHFHPRERVLYLGKEIETSLERADMVITDSDFIKNEIIERLGIPEGKIGVAKLACSDEFHPRAKHDLENVLAKYGLKFQSYTLYAGTIEPRKNLANLIRAYEKLPQKIRSAYPLVLAGYKGWNNDEIMKLIDRGRREGWLLHLGFIPGADLPLLYAGAKLFSFPSHYEGFGLPILEAMASGVPIMTSNRASLPEVGGSCALYTEPNDIENMCNLLEKGLLDQEWRKEAIQNGLKHAATFSWQRCAQETADIYRLASQ